MKAIQALNEDRRVGPNPDNFNLVENHCHMQWFSLKKTENLNYISFS